MNLTYENIYCVLNKNYRIVNGKEKNYFLDNRNRVVASFDDKSIVMYYAFPECSREIWNHKGKVAIVFVKDFNVNGNICDILCIDGLCGTFNDYIINENVSIIRTINNEFGSLLQTQFESLSYKEKNYILEKIIGAKFTGANSKGIKLFKDNYECKLGNCGHLMCSNGIANFDICGDIKFNNVVVGFSPFDFQFNIVSSYNGFSQPNYKELYEFWRKENDWEFTLGAKTAGSSKIREYTYRRMYSTVDEDSIHYSDQALNQMTKPIYERGSQSLNSKRLQMLYTLSTLLGSKHKATQYISSHYDFNIRKCDKLKQKTKCKMK